MKTNPRHARKGWTGFEPLEPRLLLTLNPTGEEQLMLEFINRMRADPAAELQIFLDSTNGAVMSGLSGVHKPTLNTQWNLLQAVPPLAWNEDLYDAAAKHNQLLIDYDIQSHRIPDPTDPNPQNPTTFVEPDLRGRASAEGYPSTGYLGENVYAFARSVFHGHAGFAVDWGKDNPDDGDGIQAAHGHRDSIMGRDTNPETPLNSGNFSESNNDIVFGFREIGISVLHEDTTAKKVGPLVVTQDFGNRTNIGNPYVLGVVFDDTDGNDFYSVGEGLSGVTVTLVGTGAPAPVTTMGAGGFQLQAPAGNYTIQFSGGSLTSTITKPVTVGADNVKVDLDLSAIPSIAFQSGTSLVREADGTAMITLVRTGDDSAPISARLTAASDTAIQGQDFSAFSQILTINAGESSRTFNVVNILDDADLENDEFLDLTLTEPGGGLLGNLVNAVLTIRDNDDHTPPNVTDLTATFAGSKIASLRVAFNELMDEASAENPLNFTLFSPGPDKRLGNGDDVAKPIKSLTYNPADNSTTITPKKKLKGGTLIRLVVSDGVTDLQLNLLDGEFPAALFPSGDSVAGGDFDAITAFGKRFKYTDSDGDKVDLQLKFGGTMRYFLDTNYNGRVLDLIEPVFGSSILTGKLKKPKGLVTDGIAILGTINGQANATILLDLGVFQFA